MDVSLTALPDDFGLHAENHAIALHALPDDFSLHAIWDTERNPGQEFVFMYYLTDELGNYLTDESGNRLVGLEEQTAYPQVLHALPDDFHLNAE